MLSPDHLRRRFTRWVSYYALFKWWLPLSQHVLGTLNDGLGCFPLDYGDYPPQSDSHATPVGIRSLIRVGKQVCPLAFSVLYPRRSAHEAIPKGISERTSYSGV